MPAPDDFPILTFRRGQGDGVFLGYHLTEKEKLVFSEMDHATLSIPIGAKHGLSDKRAIAFWTRATFSTFEP